MCKVIKHRTKYYIIWCYNNSVYCFDYGVLEKLHDYCCEKCDLC